MKRIIYLMLVAFCAIQLQSCSSDDDTAKISELEKNYLSIENAVYKDGDIPEATTEETLDGIDMSSQVMNGAMNYITIVTEKQIRKFYIGVKGVPGFWEYMPSNSEITDNSPNRVKRENTYYNTYLIPVMMSQSYSGNTTIILSGQLDNGDITTPVENDIYYIETMPGEIEIKLAFSNSKDVDLHLYTPNGEHIYYNNRGGTYVTDDGESISYGLDIDSNAGCNLDHKNKENIYIPSELIQNGTYKVVVNMYNNCDKSIPTSWSVVARYKGDLIKPDSGVNPAAGVYPIGVGCDDMTTVMTFTINNEESSKNNSKRLMRGTFKPTPLSEKDKMKIEEAEYLMQFAN